MLVVSQLLNQRSPFLSPPVHCLAQGWHCCTCCYLLFYIIQHSSHVWLIKWVKSTFTQIFFKFIIVNRKIKTPAHIIICSIKVLQTSGIFASSCKETHNQNVSGIWWKLLPLKITLSDFNGTAVTEYFLKTLNFNFDVSLISCSVSILSAEQTGL